MKIFFIPVPIFDEDMAVMAYYFRYQHGDNPIIFDQKLTHQFDGKIASQLFDLLDEIGIEPFTLGRPIFVPVSNINLLSGFSRKGVLGPKPDQIILRLDETVTEEDIYIDAIKKAKDEGYKIALKLPKNVNDYRVILGLCDYIVVDQKTANKKEAMQLIKGYPNAKSVATHVDSYNLFNLANASGYDMFEGKFYSIPVPMGQTEISPLKMISIQLLNEVSKDDFDINEVAQLIQKDVALTVSLLSFVNSQQKGDQKISTISHAAAMLGQYEIRKWCSTAASSAMASDKPNEINKHSLIRAKFAENLAPIFGLSKDSESIFLMGLFSMLDVIMDKSIEEALTLVSVSEDIKAALVYNNGKFSQIYEFIQKYESCDWTNVARLMILNNSTVEEIFEAYMSTLTWYKDLLHSFEAFQEDMN